MITILWDASHIWGYLLLHAVRSTGLPFRVLKGREIAQSGLSCKLIVVPGGAARRKLEALGSDGAEAVRAFVRGGGSYVGFCGGSGLALADGLGLCPWGRADMADRLQHLVSGRLMCRLDAASESIPPAMRGSGALLPVWWPGRFDEPSDLQDVRVLARYTAPGPDLYVADMPYASLPPDILAEWHSAYGVTLRPSILDGRPCVIEGGYGRGSWLLSYSHLETPPDDTPDSDLPGRWFLHLLRKHTGASPEADALPPLSPESIPVVWDDPVLLGSMRRLEELVTLASELGLMFPRTPWLLGWRAGVPGSQFNSLRIALASTRSLLPDCMRTTRWNALRGEFSRCFELFHQGARSWLLARRLADTLADSVPGMMPRELLIDRRRELFGSPMVGGGLCGSLLDMLEALV
ncbi:MAG: BPL-N domain-containing protein [Mailhella sp.]|nr:BPL-N domain-containing protein [Mailhella sp.]